MGTICNMKICLCKTQFLEYPNEILEWEVLPLITAPRRRRQSSSNTRPRWRTVGVRTGISTGSSSETCMTASPGSPVSHPMVTHTRYSSQPFRYLRRESSESMNLELTCNEQTSLFSVSERKKGLIAVLKYDAVIQQCWINEICYSFYLDGF